MSIYKRTGAVVLALATSANGTARNGTALPTNLAHPGTIVAQCYSIITTADVAATFKVQVSKDNGTTWYDLKLANNAANVATAVGTGAPVETFLALQLPVCVSSYLQVRVVATLAGASTAAADKTQVDFQYIQMGGLQP